MSWTYDGTPADSVIDAVRFLSGQVSSGADVIVTDEEITYARGRFSGDADRINFRAAALVLDSLAARYAVEPERESVSELGLTWGDVSQKLATRADQLRKQGEGLAGVAPYAGGVSISDKRTDGLNTDLVRPAFAVGMMDYPGLRDSTGVST